MKTLTLILLLLATASFGQTKRIEKKAMYFSTWVKTGYPNQQVSCNRLYVKLYIGRRRVVLHCDEVSLDLRITRKRTSWTATDKSGDRYVIHGININGTSGMLFVPLDPTRVGIVLIDQDICEE